MTLEDDQNNNSFTSAFSDAAKGAALPPSDASSSTPPVSTPVSTPAPSSTPAAPSQPAQQPVAAQPSQPTQQPAVQPTVPSAQAVPQTPNPLFAQAQQLGFTGQPTEAELAKWAFDRMQGQQQYVQFAQQVLPYQDQFNKFLASQQQPEPAAPAAEEWTLDKYFAERWPAPKWDDRFDKMISAGIVQKDPATGLFMPTPGYEVMAGPMLNELNQAAASQAEQIQSLFRGNPLQNIYQAVEEPLLRKVEEMVAERLNGTFSQRDELQQVMSYEQANSSWLHQADPTTGTQGYSAKGYEFLSTIQAMKPKWHGTQEELLHYAERIVGANQQQPAAPPQLPQTPPALPAVQQPPVPQAPQQALADTTRLSFLDKVRQSSHSNNSGGAPASAPEAFNVAHQGEQDNLFTNAFRANAGKI